MPYKPRRKFVKPKRRIIIKRPRRKRTSPNFGHFSKDVCFYKAPNNVPFPSVLHTVFRSRMMASLPTNAFSITGNYQFNIDMNSTLQPFASFGVTGLPVPSAGYSFSQNYPGFFLLATAAGSPYNTYQVQSFSMKLRFVPQQSTDDVQVCITPTTQAGVPVALGFAVNQRMSKSRDFKYLETGNNWLTHNFQLNKVLGLSKLVYNNDSSGNFAAAAGFAPLTPIYCRVTAQTMDNQATTALMPIEIQITAHVKLYNDTGADLSTL